MRGRLIERVLREIAANGRNSLVGQRIGWCYEGEGREGRERTDERLMVVFFQKESKKSLRDF